MTGADATVPNPTCLSNNYDIQLLVHPAHIMCCILWPIFAQTRGRMHDSNRSNNRTLPSTPSQAWTKAIWCKLTLALTHRRRSTAATTYRCVTWIVCEADWPGHSYPHRVMRVQAMTDVISAFLIGAGDFSFFGSGVGT